MLQGHKTYATLHKWQASSAFCYHRHGKYGAKHQYIKRGNCFLDVCGWLLRGVCVVYNTTFTLSKTHCCFVLQIQSYLDSFARVAAVWCKTHLHTLEDMNTFCTIANLHVNHVTEITQLGNVFSLNMTIYIFKDLQRFLACWTTTAPTFNYQSWINHHNCSNLRLQVKFCT